MRVAIHDDLPPEASAMLQALYSRSAGSVEDHVQKVRERGADRFMASFYVGYGHASIGDCGYTTLYIEDVSVLACKAVQDNPLFSGQETSTRYIDFSKQRVVDPLGTERSQRVLARWIDFYTAAEPKVRDHLERTIARPEGQERSAWRKAVAARTFDILRGFLPAGVTSQTAWTTSLRQAQEHGLRLSNHPLAEVREIGDSCLSALRQKYTSSFSHEVSTAEAAYLRLVAEHESYAEPDPSRSDDVELSGGVSNGVLEEEALDLIASRPRRSALPKALGRLGRYRCTFRLDFGSFRDLQRHRGGLCRMPLLTDAYGLHPWYLGELPADLRQEAEGLLAVQGEEIAQLAAEGGSRFELQYLQPMGMLVDTELHYDLPQMVYVAELRSGETVHPTLRKVAQRMAAGLSARHPKLALYIDACPDAFSLRRGTQDIVELPVAAPSAA